MKKRILALLTVMVLLLSTMTSYATGFTDLKDSKGKAHWSATYINDISSKGLVSGYSDGTFRPNETITREEAMSMYAKAMEITKLDNIDKARISKYKDKDSVSKWAYSAVQSTVGSGVFNGRTIDKIEPKGIFTYAEAATAIRNLLVKTELINK